MKERTKAEEIERTIRWVNYMIEEERREMREERRKKAEKATKQ